MIAPAVSVVTPFLDAERFLDEAIGGVVAQSFSDWELLLIDDGSTDRSGEIARAWERRDPRRIRLLRHPGGVNRGAAASRNVGLREARGELVALLDADDLWEPGKLAEQVERLRAHPDAELLYGRSRYWHAWDPAATEPDDVPEHGLHVESDRTHAPPSLLVINYPLGRGSAPCPSSIVLRRSLIERIGGFEESFHGPYQLYEDQVFLARAYLRGRVHVAGDVWDRYRLHPASCVARVMREGRYDEIRFHFLEWLERYLAAEGVTDPEVWQALEMALWPYRGEPPREPRAARDPGPPAPAPPDAAYEGHWDAANAEEGIAGWARDAAHPGAFVDVEVLDGEHRILTLRANRFRADLRDAGKGSGRHAFTCPLPPRLRDGTAHVLRLRIPGSGFELPGSPRTVRCAEE